MANIPGFDLRYTYVTDISYLRTWLQAPGMLHWFPMQEEKELEDAIACWIGFARYSASLTATIDSKPCGIATLFLMPYRKVSHHCMFKMIVDPRQQRKGIGSALVNNLKHLAKNYFGLELLHIEVFEDNPILSLLSKFAFTQFVRQERFVKEDGRYLARILMECSL